MAKHKHDNYTMKQDDKYKKQEKQDENDNRSIATDETSLAQFGGMHVIVV